MTVKDAILQAATELEAVHRQDGKMCVTCGASDGSWPCISAMVAHDLRNVAASLRSS